MLCRHCIHMRTAGFAVWLCNSGNTAPATNNLQLTFEAVCQDSSKVSEELQGFECKRVEMVHGSVSGRNRRSECQNVSSTISRTYIYSTTVIYFCVTSTLH